MIRCTLASKKGASSILVILLLVVLLVFGVAALTTALSSMRLGQKVTDWNERYYAAEGLAWERYAEIDRASKTTLSGEDADAAAVKKALTALDFETATETADSGLLITFESWAEDETVGIHVVLLLNLSDGSMTVEQWREIQQEGMA